MGNISCALTLERETGIEPASLAWKARVLPLNYSRLEAERVQILKRPVPHHSINHIKFMSLVERAGFEPAYS